MHSKASQSPPTLSALDTLQYAFASQCAQSLSTACGIKLRPAPLPASQLSYREFLLTLSRPTFLLIFTSSAFSGQLALEIHPGLAYLLLEQLLGAPTDGEPFVPHRSFTKIESQLLTPILDEILKQLAAAWPTSAPITFSRTRLDYDGDATHIVPADERVTVLPIDLALPYTARRGHHTSFRMSLCLPSMALEHLDYKAPARPDAQVPSAIRLKASIETTLTEEELSSLAPGDILTTELPINAALPLAPAAPQSTSGRKSSFAFRGLLVQLHGNKAIQITQA
ncbi:MAG TPA: hypothetical protein VF669_18585 [Tepidisphaeraceae bacterium]